MNIPEVLKKERKHDCPFRSIYLSRIEDGSNRSNHLLTFIKSTYMM